MSRIFGAILAVLLASSAEAVPTLIAKSAHFTIYAAESESELRAMAVGLERYNAVLRQLTGSQAMPDVNPLTIYVVPNREDVVAARSIGRATEGTNLLGYYEADPSGAIAVVPRKVDGAWVAAVPKIVLFHEYAHHFMLANFPAVYSTWFIEGLAEFYSTAEVSEAVATIGKPDVLRIRDLMSPWRWKLTDLITPGKAPWVDSKTYELYARSWLLVHYLTLSSQRGGQIQGYLRARSSGQTEEQAFQTAFHTTISGMDGELKSYFESHRLSFISLNVPDSSPIAIRAATPAEVAVAALRPRLQTMRAYRGLTKDPTFKGYYDNAANRVAIDARAAARRNPDDADLREAEAEADLIAGQADLAEAAAREALRLSPRQTKARLLLAKRALQKAPRGDAQSLSAARREIVVANQMAPDDPLPLIAYYGSFADYGVPVPEIAVQGLERAQQLIPQSDAVRLALAKELAARKRYDSAAFLLRPVAMSPHDGAMRKAAQELLKTLPVQQEAAPQTMDLEKEAAPSPTSMPPAAHGRGTQ